jgi:hypothetical protein
MDTENPSKEALFDRFTNPFMIVPRELGENYLSKRNPPWRLGELGCHLGCKIQLLKESQSHT